MTDTPTIVIAMHNAMNNAIEETPYVDSIQTLMRGLEEKGMHVSFHRLYELQLDSSDVDNIVRLRPSVVFVAYTPEYGISIGDSCAWDPTPSISELRTKLEAAQCTAPIILSAPKITHESRQKLKELCTIISGDSAPTYYNDSVDPAVYAAIQQALNDRGKPQRERQ